MRPHHEVDDFSPYVETYKDERKVANLRAKELRNLRRMRRATGISSAATLLDVGGGGGAGTPGASGSTNLLTTSSGRSSRRRGGADPVSTSSLADAVLAADLPKTSRSSRSSRLSARQQALIAQNELY